MNLSIALLAKLGSLIIHYQEFNSKGGHEFDKTAIDQIEADPEVQEWLLRMQPFLPVKR